MQRVMTVTALVAASAGCNGLFYHPMGGVLTTPAQFELPFVEAFEEVEPGVIVHLWRIAANAGGKRYGTVLHLHGNAENMTSHFLYAVWLTEYGFDVVTVDYRGYGQSTGEPDREGLVKDARTAIRFAERGDGDLFVLAQSLGGAVAVPALVAERPAELKAVAIDSTFASYRGVARDKLASFWLSWPWQWPLSFLVSDDLSPVDAAGSFKWPVVMTHDPEDPVVPFSQGDELFQALGSKDKELWRVGGGRHTFAYAEAEGQLVWRRKLAAFFCAHARERAACERTAKEIGADRR